MKNSLLIVLSIIFIITTSCSSIKNERNLEFTGTIQSAGITSYQYGTHTISNEETFYAIRSKNIQLGKYEGKLVTIVAKKITGYPLDNGPDFYEVEEIRE